MDAALGWLGRIVEFLFSLLPHLYTVDANYRAVKYPMGREPVLVGPGVHVYWPVVTNEPTLVNVKRMTFVLQTQNLTTADGRTVALTLGVIGRLSSPVKAVHGVEDYENDIAHAALRSTPAVVLAREFDSLRDDIRSGRFERDATAAAKDVCRRYGFLVETVYVVDWAPSRVIALLRDSG